MPVRSLGRRDLNPGDVVMFRGSDFIARLIIEFDGGDYSHSAIYVGGGEVLEAIAQGVKRRTLEESIADHQPDYVDVFRFSSDTHIVLDGQLPYDPAVKARADHYEHEGDHYAYEDLILLALLTTTRQIPTTGLILRRILNVAAETIARMLAQGEHPLICSLWSFVALKKQGFDTIFTFQMQNYWP